MTRVFEIVAIVLTLMTSEALLGRIFVDAVRACVNPRSPAIAC
jgi:hypothetical protein